MRRFLPALVTALVVANCCAAGSALASPPSVQTGGQAATTLQGARSTAESTQVDPANYNISVQEFSSGNTGPVTQSNSSSATSTASNTAGTMQSMTQNDPTSGCCASPTVQTGGQMAGTGQSANSSATSSQDHPANHNIRVQLFSHGDSGPVDQSNSSDANSAATNTAKTGQSLTQNDPSSGCCGNSTQPTLTRTVPGSTCCGGPTEQTGGQKAFTGQKADSSAKSTQTDPANYNIQVQLFSSGNSGPVSQSNSSSATSTASNTAGTMQSLTQNDPSSGCCGGPTVQTGGQMAGTGQWADSSATSTQDHPANYNISVQLFSNGNSGPVDQSNSSNATSAATNDAKTGQSLTQNDPSSRCCGAPIVQTGGQKALTLQGAKSSADSSQEKPANFNIAKPSKRCGCGCGCGDSLPVMPDGDPIASGNAVDQSNDSSAGSKALNMAPTVQDLAQNE